MHTEATLTGKTGAEALLLHRRLAAFKSRQETARDDKTMTGKAWVTALSLQEFYERLVLLSQLELPCIIFIANSADRQVCSGVIRHIERTDDRLELLGDDFALHLHRQNIGSLWLVNDPDSEEGAMAVEIYNRAGALITRIFGIQDRVGNAVWQDVMGNPSLCLSREARIG